MTYLTGPQHSGPLYYETIRRQHSALISAVYGWLLLYGDSIPPNEVERTSAMTFQHGPLVRIMKEIRESGESTRP